ncbi:MAG TPA: phage holin family protein, partial [Firmicutes bacterium]|nr:phage holin family protein [Bacillota bacterium]
VFCLIILANVIDQILNLNGWLAFTTVLFYIATEGLSILENLAEFGVNVPAAIRDKLKVIQEKSKEDKEA